jgi:hypothetical protein
MASDRWFKSKTKIRISHGVEDEIMKRQNWKCCKCSIPFAPPNALDRHLRQIKTRTSGNGYHIHKQNEDYLNLGFYCDACFQGETVSVVKHVRIKQVKLKKYNEWMDGNPGFTMTDRNGKTKNNFSAFVKVALENLTDEEWFEAERAENWEKLETYRSQAESFLDILTMYNDREDELDFINKVVHFFQHYTPPVRVLNTDEQIDASTNDLKLRTFLKEVRNAEIRYISEQKEAGYLHYETNSELFKE